MVFKKNSADSWGGRAMRFPKSIRRGSGREKNVKELGDLD